MQINQSQTSFRAHVPSVEPLIAKHFSNDAKTAQILREEAEKLEKIGPDSTTTHQIICDRLNPQNLGVETTIIAPRYLKHIKAKLLPEQIAQAAGQRYTQYIRENASAATIATV